MKRIVSGVLSVVAVALLAGCSSYHSHHHGMMGSGSGDAYWQKGRQDMATLINRTVKDPAKANQVNEIVGDIVEQLKAGREQERGYHRQLYTLNGSYSATPADFTKILNEAGQQRMATSAKILTLRFRMKDLMTEDEWKALTDQMLSYSGKYQHGGSGAKMGGY